MRCHHPNPFCLLLTRLVVGLLLTLAFAAPGLAAGLLKPLNGGSPLAITSHQVEVVINNGFARTEIDQTFSNPADAPLEALYTFPLPKQASLSELSMWVAEQERIGEVVEKEKARQLYEAEKAAGKQAALSEKNDFKTFETRVGNIPPGGEVRIRMVYYQPLEIDLNVGRYLYPLAEGNVDEEQLQFWSVDDRVSGSFRFHLQLKSAFPVKDVRLPGLQNEAVINQAAGTGEQGNGNDYEVTIDRPAGSMGGHKIATLADGVSRVLGQLRSNDRFRLITFNTRARDLTGGFVPADPGRVQDWIKRVKTIQAGGGTNLFAGLKAGYRNLDADRTSATILVTDGVANVGETEHRAFLRLLKKYDVRLFTFVIGNSANQPLLDRLAGDSGGFAMNISDSDDITGRLLQAKAKVLHQCLRDVKLEIRGGQVQLDAPQTLGNLYAGQQLILFGRYSTPGEIGITLKAKISGREQSWRTTAILPKVDTDNPELERLRALEKIEQTMQQIREQGETDALRSKVVDLGLNSSLVTDYTSMLVVTDDVLESHGIEKRNADRVQRERRAQQLKTTRPAKSYRVDNQGKGAFGGRSAPGLGLGSGPVGPLGVALLAWLRRRRNQLK
ncbi:VWA domain-containing protein [Geothermobacter hydrogeniphilus]|uniref:VWA domain-containing protein n=1 Tax=Geothermobacter hydrogeniphilus TaxID=1969733 RepID=A0A2K2H6U1_9BACT|nr:VIT domain-containing protein [Geothermobacter hydrogeniphilus]PNU18967.1 VWA domain-containing protein [Geothermobacter hydrogeniphilus]